MKTKTVPRRTLGLPGGFTLIELLTVMATVGILAALLLPAVSRVQRCAGQVLCEKNLRQVNLAIRLYAQDFGEAFPVLPDPNPYPNGVGAYYKELVKGYVGLSGPPTPKEAVFICPSDRSIHLDALHAFGSYTFNGYEVDPLSLPRITGQKLDTLQNPARAVVVGEWTAFFGGSWHPRRADAYPDAPNLLAFADGHQDLAKIYWDGLLGSEPRNYEPPSSYGYSWSGR